jgi:hypothetical protein
MIRSYRTLRIRQLTGFDLSMFVPTSPLWIHCGWPEPFSWDFAGVSPPGHLRHCLQINSSCICNRAFQTPEATRNRADLSLSQTVVCPVIRRTRVDQGVAGTSGEYQPWPSGSGSPPPHEHCATILVQMAWQHILNEDLERYYLGMVTDESELASLEEHLLACPSCVDRAEEAENYVDALRAAIIEGDFDLE